MTIVNVSENVNVCEAILGIMPLLSDKLQGFHRKGQFPF